MHSFDITDPDTYIEMEAWERLRSIIDPELHVNIIDLGLVYTIRAK
ncbi:metal-sulfur cluster biosynthetic enzyme [Mucilaginibacter sp. OAE612]